MAHINTPGKPPKSNEPVKYHCHDSCNKCGGVNIYKVTDAINGQVMECKTRCKDCGFADCWAHGFFESGQEIKSKCKTYSFGGGK